MTETALEFVKPTALNYSASEPNPDAFKAVSSRSEHNSSLEHSSHSESSSHLPGTLPVADLDIFARDYLLDCDYRMQSPRTIETRRIFIQNLLWFLRNREFTVCGTPELRKFFSYLSHGHEEPGGRWGNAQLTKPLRPVSIKD